MVDKARWDVHVRSRGHRRMTGQREGRPQHMHTDGRGRVARREASTDSDRSPMDFDLGSKDTPGQ